MSEQRRGAIFQSPSEIRSSSYLKVDAALEQSVLDLAQDVVAEVELPEELEVPELPGAERGVVVVAEEVVSQTDHLQGVLDAVKDPLGQTTDLVPGEVNLLQGQV